MMSKKRSGSSEAVYQQLKKQILYLELPPGASISEIDTASQYKVSRTPVRDAFRALEAEGLLEIKPHIGTFVSLIDLHTISDILYIRESLEQSVLRDLSNMYDKSQEFRIRLLLQQQKDLIDSNLPIKELSRKFIKADNEFHAALYELAGKKNVLHYFQTLNSQYERFRTFVNFGGKEDLQRLYEDHMKILECISEKHLDELQECVSHHIYDGFNASSTKIYNYPEYFKPVK